MAASLRVATFYDLPGIVTSSTLLVSDHSRDLLHHVPGFDQQRHFLLNPFSVEELLRRVRDLLAR